MIETTRNLRDGRSIPADLVHSLDERGIRSRRNRSDFVLWRSGQTIA